MDINGSTHFPWRLPIGARPANVVMPIQQPRHPDTGWGCTPHHGGSPGHPMWPGKSSTNNGKTIGNHGKNGETPINGGFNGKIIQLNGGDFPGSRV